MDIKFEPPVLRGTEEERIRQIELWFKQLCENLNIAFDMMEGEINGRLKNP